jgi:hypothetical protein
MFLGTEFGIYFTLSGGEEWIKLKGGVPTISFRDLAIQKRENDLVGASFGRGFYVFDDYSFLRELNPSDLKNKEAEIFTGRDALWFLPRGGHGFSEKGSQGAGYFTADNPPYGATFTYYLADSYKTKKQIRQETEKKLLKENKVITFPGWENVEVERTEEEPTLWLTIKDNKENVVRKIEAKNKKGFNRVSWNLRYPSYSAIDSQKDLPKTERGGILAQPGNYTATLSKQIAGEITDIAGPKSFTVKKLQDGTLKGSSSDEILVYSKNVTELQKKMTASSIKLEKATKKIKSLQYAASKMTVENKLLDEKIYSIKQNLIDLDTQLNGNKSKTEVGEKNNPTIFSRLSIASSGTSSTYGPTVTHIRSYEIAKKQYPEIEKKLNSIVDIELPSIEKELIKNGAPIVE